MKNYPIRVLKSEGVPYGSRCTICGVQRTFQEGGPCELHSRNILNEDFSSEFSGSLLPAVLEFTSVTDDCDVFGISARESIAEGTVLGPLTGLVSNFNGDPDSFSQWLLASDLKETLHRFSSMSDEACNWMKYVRIADIFQQENLVAYQEGGKIYFLTTKRVYKDDELRLRHVRAVLSASSVQPLAGSSLAQASSLVVAGGVKQMKKRKHDETDTEAEGQADRGPNKSKPNQHRVETFTPSELLANSQNQVPDPLLFSEVPGEPFTGSGSGSAETADKGTWRTSVKLQIILDFNPYLHPKSALWKPAWDRIVTAGLGRSAREGVKLLKNFVRQEMTDYTKRVEEAAAHGQESAAVTSVRDRLLQRIVDVKAHYAGFDFRCPDCPAAFVSQGLLTVHRFKHVDTPKSRRHCILKCPTCKMEHFSSAALAVHVEQHGVPSDDPMTSINVSPVSVVSFACPHCKHLFRRRLVRNRHVQQVHRVNPPDQMVQCPFCPRQFTSERVVKMHKTKCHDPDEIVQCLICVKELVNAAALPSHMEIHRGPEAQWACRHCPEESFRDLKLLCSHLRERHEQEEPWLNRNLRGVFPCPECPAVFPGRRPLERHVAIHSVALPHKCANCGCVFKQRGSLDRHNKSAHCERLLGRRRSCRRKVPAAPVPGTVADSGFPCETCGRRFRRQFLLHNHTKRVHQMAKLVSSVDFAFCVFCNKNWHDEQRLMRHQQMRHTGASCELETVDSDVENEEQEGRLGQPNGDVLPRSEVMLQTVVDVNPYKYSQPQAAYALWLQATERLIKAGRMKDQGHGSAPLKHFVSKQIATYKARLTANPGNTDQEKAPLGIEVATQDRLVTQILELIASRPTEFNFPCPDCVLDFPSEETLLPHRLKHTNEPLDETTFTVSCSSCGMEHDTLADLAEHVVKHAVRRDGKIGPLCKELDWDQYVTPPPRGSSPRTSSFTFTIAPGRLGVQADEEPFPTELDDLFDQLSDIHNPQEEFRSSCPDCARVFPSEDLLAVHSHRHANNSLDWKSTTCPSCGVTCDTLAAFVMHVDGHSRLVYGNTEYGPAESLQNMMIEQKLEMVLEVNPYQTHETQTPLRLWETVFTRLVEAGAMLGSLSDGPSRLEKFVVRLVDAHKVRVKAMAERIRCGQSVEHYAGSRKDELLQQILELIGDEYPCSRCETRFAGAEDCLQHLSQDHPLAPPTSSLDSIAADIVPTIPEPDTCTVPTFRSPTNPFQCPVCAQVLPGILAWQSHTEKHRGLDGHFRCDHCPLMPYSTFKALCAHVAGCHDDSRPHPPVQIALPVVCPLAPETMSMAVKLAPKAFSTMAKLVSKTVPTAYPYTCPTCGKVLNNAIARGRHAATHSDTPPGYACVVCGRKFHRQDYLDQHLKRGHSHTRRPGGSDTERAFSCAQCPLKFTKAHLIRQHELIHTDVLPFECTTCGRKFKRKAVVETHSMRVHQLPWVDPLPKRERKKSVLLPKPDRAAAKAVK